MKQLLLFACSLVACVSVQQSSLAHFPWLIVDGQGKAAMFFGEGLTSRNGEMPESIQSAEIFYTSENSTEEVAVESVASDEFVGLRSSESAKPSGVYTSNVTYGIYHGSLLKYYASHHAGRLPKSVPTIQNAKGLSAVAVDKGEAGVAIIITVDGKPKPGVKVKLYCSEGHEEAATETDVNGIVLFSDHEVEDGLNGIMLGYNVDTESSDFEGQSYKSVSHYLTMTFQDPDDFPDLATDVSSPKIYPDLPFEITSFGSAKVGSVIYAYGGHNGAAHSYSKEEQSNQMLALDLSDLSAGWKSIATNKRLQGLDMIGWKDELILIGGFSAMNDKGEENELISQPTVRAFNTDSNEWRDLPSLPEGRSSHDAAIIGDQLYVVGGWTLAGDAETEWHTTALRLDLSDKGASWTEIAEPPFKRRALAAVAHLEKVYVIGGMSNDRGPTRAVSIYDPSNDSWSEGPELPGEKGMVGFGAAAISHYGELYASTYDGQLLQLSKDGSQWKSLGETDDARFFHRLESVGENQILSIGGANMESGKFLTPELIRVEK